MKSHLLIKRLACACICLLPSIVSAHPGHYHPDETDEFDFLRASFFHAHGTFEYLLGAVVIINLVIVCLNEKSAVRFSALALAGAALSAIVVL